MPTLNVDEQGNSLYYEDSEAPEQTHKKAYTTLIILHGAPFHGGKLPNESIAVIA